MADVTSTTDNTIYVNYGFPPDGGKLKAFLWKTGGSRSWSEFPVKLVRSTMFVKHELCTDTITYSSSTATNQVLPTQNGPVVEPGDASLAFSLQVQLEGGDPGDDEVTIGAITTDPRGHDFFLVPLPRQAMGQAWGKGGKRLTVEHLDRKTVKRLELLQKNLGDLEAAAKGHNKK